MAHGVDRLTSLETFARAGHAARGVVYMLLGYFALTTARRGGQDPTSVLRQIEEMPLSLLLLILLGLGLLCWGLFRLYGAAVDIQGKGSDLRGIAERGGHALSGLAHIALCYVAIRLALGGGAPGSGAETKQAAATAAGELPLGETLIAAVGIGFALAGLQQIGKAATGNFMRLMSPRAPAFTEWLGRAGYGARGIVFAVLGWQILQVALGNGKASHAGIGSALDSLRDTGSLYMLVAAGLMLFGVFSLVMARYRYIPDEDVLDRLRGERRPQL